MLRLLNKVLAFIKNLFKKKVKEKIVFTPNNNFKSWSEIEKDIATRINVLRNEQTLYQKVVSLFRTSSKDLIPEKISRREAIYRTVYQTTLDKISHNNMGVSSEKLKREGLSVYGEILAYGYLNAEAVVSAWYKSDSHRKMMLDSRYKYFGVAHIYSETKNRNYYCVVFSNI